MRMKVAKNNQKFILFALLVVLVSCKESPRQTGVETTLEKIKKSTANESDINDLLDSVSVKEGVFEVNVPKANFKVTFPVLNVKESTKKQILENKTVEIFSYTANLQGKNHVNLGYQLDYVFLPELRGKQEIENFFNEQREFILSMSNSTLEFENVIELNGASGRHLFFTVDESSIKTNCKMYFKNGVFYKLSVVTENGKLFNKSISKFFDSFEITN